jgi:hypothetical protein
VTPRSFRFPLRACVSECREAGERTRSGREWEDADDDGPALAAGVTLFELARIMGTSVRMIERSYGTLLGGAHAGIAGRLDALEAELEEANEAKEASEV